MPTYDEAMVELARRELARRQGMTHTTSSKERDWKPEWSDVPEVAGSIGRGVIEAGRNLLGLPVDAANLIGEAINDPTVANPRFNMPRIPGGADDIQSLGEKYGPQIYQPTTPFKRGVTDVSRGAAGMAGPGTGAGLATLGGVSGLAETLAEQVIPEGKTKDAARMAALAPLLALFKKPKAVALLQDAINEPGLNLAAVKAAQAGGSKALGVPTLMSHFLPERSLLFAKLKEVAESPQGGAIQRVMMGEEAAKTPKIQDLIQTLSQAPVNTSTRNIIAEAGTKAMQRPQDVRTNITSPSYKLAARDELTGAQVSFLADAIRGVKGKYNLPPTSQSGRAVEAGARKVENAAPPSVILNPRTGKGFETPLSVLEADVLRKEAATRAQAADKLNATSTDINKRLGESGVAAAINEATHAASPALEAGQALHSRASKALVDPVEKGPLAEMFSDATRKTGVGSWTDYPKLLLHPEQYDVTDIAKVGAHLKKANPKAWPLIVKQHVLANSDLSMKGLGEHLLGKGGELGSRQTANMKEAVKQVHLSAGKTAQEADFAAEGAINLLETMRTVGSGQARIRAPGSASAEEAGRTATSTVLKMFNFLPLNFRAWQEGSVMEKAAKKKVFARIAEILADPNAADLLIDIAKWDRKEKGAEILARAFGGYQGGKE